MPHRERRSIETRVSATLREVVRQVVASAGLGLVRGAVGIGKTYALDTITGELVDDGVKVVRLTATPAIEGSVSAFTRAALGPMSDMAKSTFEAVEFLSERLSAYPFSLMR